MPDAAAIYAYAAAAAAAIFAPLFVATLPSRCRRFAAAFSLPPPPPPVSPLSAAVADACCRFRQLRRHYFRPPAAFARHFHGCFLSPPFSRLRRSFS